MPPPQKMFSILSLKMATFSPSLTENKVLAAYLRAKSRCQCCRSHCCSNSLKQYPYNFECIHLLLFYSVIFQSVIFRSVIFQSCKFQSYKLSYPCYNKALAGPPQAIFAPLQRVQNSVARPKYGSNSETEKYSDAHFVDHSVQQFI